MKFNNMDLTNLNLKRLLGMLQSEDEQMRELARTMLVEMGIISYNSLYDDTVAYLEHLIWFQEVTNEYSGNK